MANILQFLKNLILNRKPLSAGSEDVSHLEESSEHLHTSKRHVKLGETIQIVGRRYGSVGLWDDVQYDASCFELKVESRYLQPAKMREGMCGADEQETTFLLTAKTRGHSTVKVISDFRGKIETKEIIDIYVD